MPRVAEWDRLIENLIYELPGAWLKRIHGHRSLSQQQCRLAFPFVQLESIDWFGNRAGSLNSILTEVLNQAGKYKYKRDEGQFAPHIRWIMKKGGSPEISHLRVALNVHLTVFKMLITRANAEQALLVAAECDNCEAAHLALRGGATNSQAIYSAIQAAQVFGHRKVVQTPEECQQ
ncbi:hypothetical protein HK097_003070 [Rhizophlyctis rosea]|uniref:Uncharacterized protein n=1 Tax=Rhizophlyctis rosea TaxID=64517 RepID=A0AAD5SF34_9FUNG|nr:hypothetical protein HK097_003070 [Rhizophlyctis rosea]